ncbi:protein NRT1/ PTR FAMILY 5.10-like isoform X2 [Papaver somniferum]|uniref:protein NRT1/ PTR FAMILY 5.10-like isoform X2 n=1 Tax=Papaver somniferum TaxID=3469 RepID=UPI000E702B34|nr:protein NRT1/ PTR FAMILY 5.10-like isoform X2 [Papaver somniferum]
MAILSGVVDGNNDFELGEPLLITTCSSSSDHGGVGNLTSSDAVQGVVDYRGESVYDRSKYGGWKSSYSIIPIDIADSFTYWGISSNLISYLTGPLGQSTVAAAENINIWGGVVSLLPFLSAFLADSYLGRFSTILISGFIYILGLGLLSLSVMLPSLISSLNYSDNSSVFSSSYQLGFFFCSLYIMAIGRAGCNSCAQAFGADQFDGRDSGECKSKSSFFNWWFLGLILGSGVSHLTLNYIQDNMGWGLGFGIPCIVMVAAIVVFLLRTKTYRYSVSQKKQNPLVRITRVFTAAAKNRRKTASLGSLQEDTFKLPGTHPGANQFNSREYDLTCTADQVEEAKAAVRLVPVWVVCIIYGIVSAQSTTFCIKQGNTMNRNVGRDFEIPSASMRIFSSVAVVFSIVFYDRVFVPLARTLTGKPSGITMLQRTGCGMFISTISMVAAAIVEKTRLQIALDNGLIDMPQATVPMSIWWLVPQYIMQDAANVFFIGMQEFFYDQVPNELRSVGLGLYSSIFGVGHFLSGFLISILDKITSGSGRDSWFSDNLNRAHIDLFYWLLAGLSALELISFIYISKSYIYKR